MYLLKVFKCHICVEYCLTRQSMAYKYHTIMRRVAAFEAAFRLFDGGICSMYPAVMRLAIHLKDEQQVYLPEPDLNASRTKSQKKTASTQLTHARATTLTQYFSMCKLGRNEGEAASTKDTTRKALASSLKYRQMSQHFTWTGKKWVQRAILTLRHSPDQSIDGRKSDTVGRIFMVDQSNVELSAFRRMLYHAVGPTCFDDLEIFRRRSNRQPTSRSACSAFC